MKLDRRFLPFWICLFFVVVFYAPLLLGMFPTWWDNPDYQHALIVIPAAVGLVFFKREKLAALEPCGSWLGLPVLLGGVAICLLSLPGLLDYPARVSIIPILAGVVLLLLGTKYFRYLIFPILFLIFMIPIPNVLYSKIAMPLQLVASRNAVSVLNNVGIDTTGDGNLITLVDINDPNDESKPFTMAVAQACSGIRSLLAMTCLGAAAVYLLRNDWFSRVFIFASSIGIAILLNVFRVTTTGILAVKVDPSMAGGNAHTIWGLVTFLLGMILLLAESKVIDWVFHPLSADSRALPGGSS